jgi:hypothetical protein
MLTSSPTKRRVASLAFGISVAVTTIRLTACFVNVGPTNPHLSDDDTDGREPGTSDPAADVSDPADASDIADASDAGEEP